MRIPLLRRVSLMDLAVLAVLIGAAVLCSGYGARARMVPMIVAVGSIGFLLLQLVLQSRGASLDIDQEELLGAEAKRAAEEAEAKEQAFAEAAPRSFVTYEGGSLWSGLAIIVGFAALILGLGVLPAVFLFVFGFLAFISRLRVLWALLLALATEGVVYGLFVLVLGVRMNRGFLIEMFL
jgi:hypothetical protein